MTPARWPICNSNEGLLRCCQDHFRDVTGLPINPYFSAYKFAWLLENVPEAKAAVEDGSAMFGTVDTYLIWRLTGTSELCMSVRH